MQTWANRCFNVCLKSENHTQQVQKMTNYYIHMRTCWPTPIAWPWGLFGQIEKGGCCNHVVEDGANTGWVSHHNYPQQVKKDHVAMTILWGISQLLWHYQMLQDRQDVVAWKQEVSGWKGQKWNVNSKSCAVRCTYFKYKMYPVLVFIENGTGNLWLLVCTICNSTPAIRGSKWLIWVNVKVNNFAIIWWKESSFAKLTHHMQEIHLCHILHGQAEFSVAFKLYTHQYLNI